MPQRLVQLLYTYEFVDMKGNFEDSVYMRENVFINYDNPETRLKIVSVFLGETDKSKILKEVTDVRMLGLRLI